MECCEVNEAFSPLEGVACMNRLETVEIDTELATGEDERREVHQQFLQAFRQNERLLKALHDAREEIAALRDEVDRLAAPPSSYGVYLAAHGDETVDVLAQGRKMRVRLRSAIDASSLRPGQELVLNEALNVVGVAGLDRKSV